jgi:hypothetical protein
MSRSCKIQTGPCTLRRKARSSQKQLVCGRLPRGRICCIYDAGQSAIRKGFVDRSATRRHGGQGHFSGYGVNQELTNSFPQKNKAPHRKV